MAEKIQYKTAMVEQKEPFITSLYCDKCKKLIKQHISDTFIKDIRNVSYMHDRVEWYEVTTGHHDWGNDSIDSIKHQDICLDCIDEVFNDYKNRASDTTTEYIEIEHCWNYNHSLKEENKDEN